jgi:hypothetical protein
VSFQLGLLLMMIYGMFQATRHPGEAVTGLYLYLFFGLVSMSAGRISTLSTDQGGRVPRFGFGWFSGLLASSLAVVGAAILVGCLQKPPDFMDRSVLCSFLRQSPLYLCLYLPQFSPLSPRQLPS